MNNLNSNLPTTRSNRSVGPLAITVGAAALAGLGLALVAWSRRYVIHDMPMTAALDGELRTFHSRVGKVAYYTAGASRRLPPMLFIHSVNAAASAYEMKPLYDYYARERKVIALDLPGYGFSERADKNYSPEGMRTAILELLENELHGEAVHAVALSLGSEYLAMAAQAAPKLFRSLAFISPTGMSQSSTTIRGNDGVLSALRKPLWARPLYDLLTSRPSMGYFLQQSQKKKVDQRLVNYAYATSHQPDAEFAPFHFLAGKLFTPTIFDTFAALTQPCLLAYGRDPFVRFDRVDELRGKPNWRILAFENAGGLTHWDDLDGVTAAIDRLVH